MFWYPNLDYLDQNEAQGLVSEANENQNQKPT